MPKALRTNSTPFSQVNARLPADLVQAAKQAALAQCVTFTAFLGQALRVLIRAYEQARAKEPASLSKGDER
jgi:hypothetical protein